MTAATLTMHCLECQTISDQVYQQWSLEDQEPESLEVECPVHPEHPWQE